MSISKITNDFVNALIGSNNFELCLGYINRKIYPIDLEFTLLKEGKYYSPKDLHGTPIKKYKSVGSQYNPTRIAAYALAHFNRYFNNHNQTSHDIFLQMADWFMKSEDGIWRYLFNWNDLKAPWISCMSQGEGISVLTRAYWLTKNDKYLQQAIKATAPFSLYICEGGVRSKIDGKWEFLEEYPSSSPTHTLNGFLYTLIGILDLSEFYPQTIHETGLNELLKTLSSQWQLWDLSYWSAYDLHLSKSRLRNYVTVSYHKIHISLVRYLYSRFEDLELKECFETWLDYYNSPINRVRALAAKVKYRMEVPPSR
ncbi:MAG: D-glucuronyl C5-epimerase [Symploca sp. SIO2E9]|nr:D-glucuronyl C5-epimerase [Symploca sp. SIO2E9]